MGKFFKSIDELNEEELESRESLAYAIGDNIGGAIRSLITPAFVMTGAVLFATPAAITLGLSCLALSVGISIAERYLLDLPQKLANPYRHALWELQDQRGGWVAAFTNNLVVPPLARGVASLPAAPEAEIEIETQTSEAIQVMRPLVLGRKRTVFNTAATEAGARYWKIKDDAQSPGRKTPPALVR